MKRVFLGKTGMEVSELSFGTLILGRIQANLTPEEAAPAVKKALEMGINLFDTACSYRTQNHLRVGLGRAKDDVIISTKTKAKTRKDARKEFEESLRELDREYIDIYHFHMVENAEDFDKRRGVLELLLELKEKGLIRAIGASVHRVEAAEVIADAPEVDVLFPIVNSRGLGIIDGSVEDMIEVCRVAKARGKGIYAMKPLAGGHLGESPKEAIDFIRDTRIMDSICIGMKSPAEVEMNACLFEGREVPKKTLDQVGKVSRTLRIYDKCMGCGGCVETCDQGALSLDYSKADESSGKKGQSVVDHTKCILCGYCAEACPDFAIRVV